MPYYSLGLDYGTESVRAIVVSTSDGRIISQSTRPYTHGVITSTLPTSSSRLPSHYALQHPADWLSDMASAVRDCLSQSSINPSDVIGIGVDFTSCTMLPALSDGTPLCLTSRFSKEPLAWPKLWKHHGAKIEADLFNSVACERKEKWLKRYGGAISVEWFWPKVLETLNGAPQVHAAADLWIEAGDWLVWQLTTGPFPHSDISGLVRSTCQAGYKAMWNAHTGYPSSSFFSAVHPKLKNVVSEKVPGTFLPPGRRAGTLSPQAAALMGLAPGIAVSTAIIDAHSGVPGAGVASQGTLVMVLGTSSCHMLNSAVETTVPGVQCVQDGILPGYFGYESGQSSVGDSFAWLVKNFGLSHSAMTDRAGSLPPGCEGVIALDWLNGCRTPLMDPHLSGAFVGLTLHSRPEHLYRALIESTAFGVRRIVDTLQSADVPVKKFVASGGLPARSPLLMQIYSDVLGQPITLAESDQSVALGAAILGAVASGKQSLKKSITSMARQRKDLAYRPNPASKKSYNMLYAHYLELTQSNGPLAKVMRRLHQHT